MNYWIEALTEALDQAAIPATAEQIAEAAKWIESAAEYRHEHEYQPEHPAVAELAATRKALTIEQSLIVCPECRGSRDERVDIGSHVAISRCYNCNGKGKI